MGTMTDLDKLIAAVEAGDMWSETQYAVFGNGTDLVNAYQAAFDGSLDAALRLHKALLPGHTRAVDATAPEMGIRVDVWSPEGPITGTGDNAVEARAWLLAVLRALQAQPTPDADTAAIRHHERFGPLDEHGNPLDPRRRG